MKRNLFRLFAVCMGVSIALSIVEVGLRIGFRKIERITGASEWEMSKTDGYTYFWDQYHPILGWTNLPNYQSDARIPFRVSINAQGLRGTRHYPPVPAAGVKRIAVFGDSCTFGEEVNDDETVPCYLERNLRDVEAINFGVHGYGLGQMALRLEGEGFAFQPDHVLVVLLLPYDIARDVKDHFDHNKPVFAVVGSELVVGNTPVPIASQQPWLQRHCFTAAYLFGRPQPLPKTHETWDDVLLVARAILQRIKSQCDQRNIPCTLVIITHYRLLLEVRSNPQSLQLYDYTRHSILQSNFESVLDLSNSLAEQLFAKDGDSLVAPWGHWSAKGNRLIADQIAKFLAYQGYFRTVDEQLPVERGSAAE